MIKKAIIFVKKVQSGFRITKLVDICLLHATSIFLFFQLSLNVE